MNCYLLTSPSAISLFCDDKVFPIPDSSSAIDGKYKLLGCHSSNLIACLVSCGKALLSSAIFTVLTNV